MQLNALRKGYSNGQKWIGDQGDPDSISRPAASQADGVVSAEPKPSLWSVDNCDVLFKPFGDEKFVYYPGGFAIRKREPEFLTFLNTWIQLYTAKGWLAERQKYWFEADG